jgi:hypothetical protein
VNLFDLFDSETGGKLRAGLAVALGVATFIVAVFQAALDSLDVLPEWEQLGAAAIWLQAVISGLGRFTKLGNTFAKN